MHNRLKMKPLANQMILPFASWLMLTALTALAQTPNPALQTPFVLPLSDGTIAQAQILPGPNAQAYLVYATKTGQLGLWTMTQTDPTPPPDPIPPIPPQPTKLKIAIVENPATTTQAQRSVLASKSWRDLVVDRHELVGVIPNDVIDKRTDQPPPRLAPFLDRAKQHNLPWIMFTDEQGNIIWEGQVPTTASELSNLIKQHGG